MKNLQLLMGLLCLFLTINLSAQTYCPGNHYLSKLSQDAECCISIKAHSPDPSNVQSYVWRIYYGNELCEEIPSNDDVFLHCFCFDGTFTIEVDYVYSLTPLLFCRKTLSLVVNCAEFTCAPNFPPQQLPGAAAFYLDPGDCGTHYAIQTRETECFPYEYEITYQEADTCGHDTLPGGKVECYPITWTEKTVTLGSNEVACIHAAYGTDVVICATLEAGCCYDEYCGCWDFEASRSSTEPVIIPICSDPCPSITCMPDMNDLDGSCDLLRKADERVKGNVKLNNLDVNSDVKDQITGYQLLSMDGKQLGSVKKQFEYVKDVQKDVLLNNEVHPGVLLLRIHFSSGNSISELFVR